MQKCADAGKRNIFPDFTARPASSAHKGDISGYAQIEVFRPVQWKVLPCGSVIARSPKPGRWSRLLPQWQKCLPLETGCPSTARRVAGRQPASGGSGLPATPRGVKPPVSKIVRIRHNVIRQRRRFIHKGTAMQKSGSRRGSLLFLPPRRVDREHKNGLLILEIRALSDGR